jgi:hypothetical protein
MKDDLLENASVTSDKQQAKKASPLQPEPTPEKALLET